MDNIQLSPHTNKFHQRLKQNLSQKFYNAAICTANKCTKLTINSHPAGSYFSWHMKSLLSHGDRLPSLGWLCYLQTRTSGTVIIVLFIDVSSLKQYPLASKWLFQNMVMSPWGFSRAESSRSPIWLHTTSDLVGLWAACWSLLSADLHSAHSVAVLVVWKPALFTLGLLIIIM